MKHYRNAALGLALALRRRAGAGPCARHHHVPGPDRRAPRRRQSNATPAAATSDLCLKQARADKDVAEAQAKAGKQKAEANHDAAKARQDADYDVAKKKRPCPATPRTPAWPKPRRVTASRASANEHNKENRNGATDLDRWSWPWPA